MSKTPSVKNNSPPRPINMNRLTQGTSKYIGNMSPCERCKTRTGRCIRKSCWNCERLLGCAKGKRKRKRKTNRKMKKDKKKKRKKGGGKTLKKERIVKFERGPGFSKYKVTVQNKKTKKKRTIKFGHKDYEQFRNSTPLGYYSWKNHGTKKRKNAYFSRHSGTKKRAKAIEKEWRKSRGKFTPKILSHIYLW